MELNRSEDFPAAAKVVLHGAEAGLSTQSELLSGVESMWTGWMQRQREAIDASAQSLTKICESQRMADIVEIQQQWFVDTMRRTVSEMSTLANDAVTLTWRVVRSDNIPGATPQPAPSGRQRVDEQASQHREAAE